MFMKWLRNNKLFGGILGLLALAYPTIVYLLGNRLPASSIIIGLIFILLARSIFQYRHQGASNIYLTLIVTAILGGLYFRDEQMAVYMYPVLMSLSFASVLGRSLIYPPSLIERFARLMEPDLDARGIAYTRNVTVTWLVFSLLNACISFSTVILNDEGIWWLYNGFISYVLIGLLMAGEYIYRGYYKAKGNQ